MQKENLEKLNHIPSNTVFQAVDNGTLCIWILSEKGDVHFRQTELEDPLALDDVAAFFQSIIVTAYEQIAV